MDGYARLKKLYKSDLNKDTLLIEIIRHLLQLPDMSENYLKEEKNLKQMRTYVFKKAKEQAYENSAAIKDDVVYGWAVEYFQKSNEELEINETKIKTAPVATKVAKKEQVNENQLSLELA